MYLLLPDRIRSSLICCCISVSLTVLHGGPSREGAGVRGERH